jgi:hypothetical protein
MNFKQGDSVERTYLREGKENNTQFEFVANKK